MRALAALAITGSVLLVGSGLVDAADIGGVDGDPVETFKDTIRVVAANDGELLEINVGGTPCVYRKLTVGDVAAIPGGNYYVPPAQAAGFVERGEADGSISFLYVYSCHTVDESPDWAFVWIIETSSGDLIGGARQEMIEVAPAPVAEFSPGAHVNHLVGLTTFVWLEGVPIDPVVVTAEVPGLSVTATATADRLLLDAGDGSEPVDCSLEPVPYTPDIDPATACGHTYDRVSSISADGRWPFRVAVKWVVTWVDSEGRAGTADPIETEAIYPLTVIELQPRTTNG